MAPLVLASIQLELTTPTPVSWGVDVCSGVQMRDPGLCIEEALEGMSLWWWWLRVVSRP